MTEQKKGVFARVVAFVSDWQVGDYTIGKEYPVLASDDPRHIYGDFTIIDDTEEPICAWWGDEDPDCVFQRVEYL